MNRIDDAANIIRSYFKESEHYPNLWEDIAGSLDIAGHLLPDMPEPDANDGIWYLHRDVIVHNGVGPCVCIEDEHHIHVFKPEEGRAVAYALLSAASYAEEHTNDQ